MSHLCSLCETFTAGFLESDFTTWKRLDYVGEQGYKGLDRLVHHGSSYTFRHGDYQYIRASATAGCNMCRLLDQVRNKRIPEYAELGQKWLSKYSSIDVAYDGENPSATFNFITILPSKPVLSFELYDYSGSGLILSRGHALPKPVALRTFDAVGLARFWLNRCLSSHRDGGVCVAEGDMPCRVIDVGPSDGSQEPRLVTGSQAIGKWASLSHCWGTSDRLTTTTSNLQEHMQCIPLSTLPATFRDAVIVTRSLGLRLLWIDALCIIQDDEDDWDQQSSAMSDIYRGAAVCLSVLDAADSNTGFLQEREQISTVVDWHGQQVGIRPLLASIRQGIARSKLSTRAWCLQEHVLPVSILHFGKEQLYWECRGCDASESHGDDVEEQLRARPATVPPPVDWHIDKIHNEWFGLISQYSGRSITKPSDRLPAIKGLAQILEQTSALGRYVQGLWLSDILRGLLWQRAPLDWVLSESRTDSFGRLPGSRRDFDPSPPGNTAVPTWSWASLNSWVKWSQEMTSGSHFNRQPGEPLQASKVDIVERTGFIQSRSAQEKHAAISRALIIEGHLKRGACKRTLNVEPDSHSFQTSSSSQGQTARLRVYLDWPDASLPKACYALLLLHVQPRNGHDDSISQTPRSFFLILERDEGPIGVGSNEVPCFRRIGIGYDDILVADTVFKNAPWTTLVLL